MPEVMAEQESSRRSTPLAVALDEAIQKRGISIRRLAELADVSQPRITQILAGDDTKPETLRRICRALFVGDADADADADEAYKIFEAHIFEAAGFVPDGYVVVNPQLRYRPNVEQMLRDIAAQYGHLDESAIRRIKRSIRAEMEEDAAERGIELELPDDF
jgi:transcriptional regulator with XRE-family HTH domain